MAIKIVTDSTMSIEPGLVEALGITVVPLTFTLSGVIYTDGDLVLPAFMEEVAAAESLPMTSQPAVGVLADIYNRLSADGSAVLSIHLSQTLSGTVEAARQGASLSTGDVTVLDSTFTDQGLKFQVVAAAQMAQDGATKEEILSAVAHIRENTDLYCGVTTLEYLIKGGRIGRVTGFIGGFLDIKLVLRMKNSELLSFRKGRGAKTFKKWLDDVTAGLATSGRKVKEIGISHVENLAFAQYLRDTLQRFVEKPISILDTSTIIATHTGSGAWAVMINYE